MWLDIVEFGYSIDSAFKEGKWRKGKNATLWPTWKPRDRSEKDSFKNSS